MSGVIVRLSTNKIDGTYEAKIVRHEGDSSCGDDIDEDILEDLLNAEIHGFGELVTQEDSGHTCEYFEEKKAKENPHSYFSSEEEGEDEEEDDHKSSHGDDLSLGFGV